MDRVESVGILGNEDSLASERWPVEEQQGSFFEAFCVMPAYDLVNTLT